MQHCQLLIFTLVTFFTTTSTLQPQAHDLAGPHRRNRRRHREARPRVTGHVGTKNESYGHIDEAASPLDQATTPEPEESYEEFRPPEQPATPKPEPAIPEPQGPYKEVGGPLRTDVPKDMKGENASNAVSANLSFTDCHDLYECHNFTDPNSSSQRGNRTPRSFGSGNAAADFENANDAEKDRNYTFENATQTAMEEAKLDNDTDAFEELPMNFTNVGEDRPNMKVYTPGAKTMDAKGKRNRRERKKRVQPPAAARSSPGCGKEPPIDQDMFMELRVDNADRRAAVHLPVGYDRRKSYKLLLSFHGLTMDGRTMAEMDDYTKFSRGSEPGDDTFILVYPEGFDDDAHIYKNGTSQNVSRFTRADIEKKWGIPSYLQGEGWRSWNGVGSSGSPGKYGPTCDEGHAGSLPWYACLESCGRCSDECWWSACHDDVLFTEQLLDKLEDTYCIDKDHIFASGFSNGAMFLYELSQHDRIAERFEGMLTVAGLPLIGFANPPASSRTRLFGIWGHKDRVVANQHSMTGHFAGEDVKIAMSSEGFYYVPATEVVDIWARARNLELVDLKLKSGFKHDCRGAIRDGEMNIVSCFWPGPHMWPAWATEYAISFFFHGKLPNLGDQLFHL